MRTFVKLLKQFVAERFKDDEDADVRYGAVGVSVLERDHGGGLCSIFIDVNRGGEDVDALPWERGRE